MSISEVVRTKLYVPSPPRHLVARSRLLEHLDHALEVPLTLVTAPAGYGKSVLIADWVRRQEVPVCWISLDPDDGDLGRFLTCLAAAFDMQPGFGNRALSSFLSVTNLPATSEIASEIVNDLDNASRHRVVVLDDFQSISATSPVQTLIAELLVHPARGLHFVIGTRRDPALPLGRLRAMGLLHEARLADLAFSDSEARELIKLSAETSVSNDELDAIQYSMEGWGVGLKLFSIAIRDQKRRVQILEALRSGTSDTREYLFAEVLGGLPKAVLDGMLQASLLERFSADLLDAITCNSSVSGIDLIRFLNEAGLFVIELDEAATWFRFHHLLQATLRSECQRQLDDESIRETYRRAKSWCREYGSQNETLQYAISAGDYEDAVGVISASVNSSIGSGRWTEIKRWLDLLPQGASDSDLSLVAPTLSVAYADWDLQTVSRVLEQVEGKALPDDATRGHVAAFRGFNHMIQGDSGNAIPHLRSALEAAHDEATYGRFISELLTPICLQMEGRLADAREQLYDWLRDSSDQSSIRLANLHQSAVFVSYMAAETEGVDAHIEQSRSLVQNEGLRQLTPWPDYQSGLFAMQRGDLELACACLEKAVQQRRYHQLRGAIDAASACAVASELAGDSDTADWAQSVAVELVNARTPALGYLANSLKARLLILRGAEAFEALRWLENRDSEMEQALLFWVNSPALVRVRALLCEGEGQDPEAALGHVLRIIDTARQQCNRVYEIDAQCLATLALDMLGRQAEALEHLEWALDLARPGRFVLPFLEFGPRLSDLLQAVGDTHQHFSAWILRKINATAYQHVAATPRNPAAKDSGLTGRERDILELLARRLQNKEIAQELAISPNTVGYHLKHIYEKLGVGNRRHAVSRAYEAGILRQT